MRGLPTEVRLSAPDDLLSHEWPDGIVHVFHPTTGETHLLNAFPAAVVDATAGRSRRLPELVEEFADLLDSPQDQVRRWLDRAVLELEASELVRIETG